MEYFKKFFATPDRRIKTETGDIGLYTTYRDFPRNAKLPALFMAPHIMERFFLSKMNVSDICRGSVSVRYTWQSLENRSRPTIIKILVDWKTRSIIGLTIAHLKGKELYVDVLCAKERNKNAPSRNRGFGSILMNELKKEAVRFNAKYLTLQSVDSAYLFYIEKMGFENRPQDDLLQWRVPYLNSPEGKRLLPEGRPTGMRPAGHAYTSINTARLQRALLNVANKRTAKVVPQKNKKTSVLPSVNTKTAASTAMIQKALTTVKKTPSPKKLPPLRTFTKSPSPRKLPSVRKTPSPMKLSPLQSVRKTRSPLKSKQGNTRMNRLRKSQ
jgi:hypothetical protein